MQFTATVQKHVLEFTFLAGTSRGVLQKKTSWFLQLQALGRLGIGEAGPLQGLSPEGTDLEKCWAKIIKALVNETLPRHEQEVYELASRLSGGVSSIQFALETALLDWLHGGSRTIFKNSFSAGESCIPINGLIWMGNRELMKARIEEKMAQGFRCLKLKIGAIDFKEELSLLQYIRAHYNSTALSIRVDANGAFPPAEAMEKLQALSVWDLHSIEQPIQQGQWQLMQALCQQSPVPIALDEELIGVHKSDEQKRLLETIRPAYIILKPSLHGGLQGTQKWIALAESLGIGWWVTSALESNIGLNAVAQFTAQYAPAMPQGLGTGQLYSNNIPSPLVVRQGELCYNPKAGWDLSHLGR